ncbi:MAG: GNAT family N-acetyltransferase [Dehalococcoidia bacterium]|nr:GNAT family N-acetyltransferase [Dehalococcoidia bacterium]
MAPSVRLRDVRPEEQDAFFEAFAAYHTELDALDDDAGVHSVEAYRAALLEDLEGSGRELWWIEADGERAGFAVVQTLPDWPDDRTDVAEITEFYVEPRFRRSGVGRAAVEAILADHRARGTRLVEAAILERNGAARAFWATLGFEARARLTARRP